jgi:hypothetical protein
VLSCRGLCDGLITRPEESYRLWRVVACDQETSRMRRLKPATGLWKIQPQWVVTPGKQTSNKRYTLWLPPYVILSLLLLSISYVHASSSVICSYRLQNHILPWVRDNKYSVEKVRNIPQVVTLVALALLWSLTLLPSLIFVSALNSVSYQLPNPFCSSFAICWDQFFLRLLWFYPIYCTFLVMSEICILY